jgi:hypothetical protein
MMLKKNYLVCSTSSRSSSVEGRLALVPMSIPENVEAMLGERLEYSGQFVASVVRKETEEGSRV